MLKVKKILSLFSSNKKNLCVWLYVNLFIFLRFEIFR